MIIIKVLTVHLNLVTGKDSNYLAQPKLLIYGLMPSKSYSCGLFVTVITTLTVDPLDHMAGFVQ